MVTTFELMDSLGKVIAYGEIDGDIYRVFASKQTSECQEFDNMEDMFAACGGVGIQPSLFETSARDRQLNFLGGSTDEGNKTPNE